MPKRKRRRRNRRPRGRYHKRGQVVEMGFNQYNKCRMNYKLLLTTATSTAAGNVGRLNLAILTHNLTTFVSNGTSVVPLTELLEHQKIQYDYYRPRAVKLEFTPAQNQAVFGSATAQIPQMVVVYDSDNSGFPSSIGSMLNRDDSRVFDPTRPFKTYFKIKDTYQGTDSAGYHNVGLGKGWNNLQAEQGNSRGVIWMSLTDTVKSPTSGNPVGNVQIGTWKVTYYCDFYGRQFAKNADGSEVLENNPSPVGSANFYHDRIKL